MTPHLDHLGIAVQDRIAVERLYRDLFGYAPYKTEAVEKERVAFLDAGSVTLELLEATRPDSALARHLESRGEGLHHVAFEVADLEAEHRRVQQLGYRVLNEQPVTGAEGRRLFFLHPEDTHGLPVAFCQRQPPVLSPIFVETPDGRIAVFEAGTPQAPPLLVLHGALGSTELETARLFPELEKHFRLLAFDFAGHGRSDNFSDQPLGLPLFAENIRAVLDQFGLERTHVFGFSMGGAVALYMAGTMPERVLRVAAHGANVFWTEDDARHMIASLHPDRIERFMPHWARRLRETHGEERWKRLSERIIALTKTLPDYRYAPEDFVRITAPVLVSGGDRDRYFPIQRLLQLHEALPTSSLAVLPGLDHPIQLLDLPLYTRMLRQHFFSSGLLA